MAKPLIRGPNPDKLPLDKMPLQKLREVLPDGNPLAASINRAPTTPIDTDGVAGATVAETLGVGALVGITASANDPDGDVVQYSFGFNGAGEPILTQGSFTIDATTGVVTLAAPLDYETAPVHSLTIYASDSNGGIGSSSHTVNVTDVLIPVDLQRVSEDGPPLGRPVEWLFPSLSADGTKVVFADGNVDLGSTLYADIFVKDLVSGEIQLVTTSSTGGDANGHSFHQILSPDGTKVYFTSYASNLVEGDTHGGGVFVKDLSTGLATRVSTSSAGNPMNGLIFLNDVSANGGFIVIQSGTTSALPGDTNNNSDLWLKNVATGELQLVSSNASGEQGNGFVGRGSVSGDGRYVAFSSTSTNLVANDTNGVSDVFIKDTVTGSITRVEGASGQLDGASLGSAILSDNGQKVAFLSRAADLGNTDNQADLFIFDVATGDITRVANQAGDEPNGVTANPSEFTSDGSLLFFESSASNLVDGDTNGVTDVFVLDVASGEILLLSNGIDGPADMSSFGLSVSADGGRVAFSSRATNLVEGDLNALTDIFVVTMDHFGSGGTDFFI